MLIHHKGLGLSANILKSGRGDSRLGLVNSYNPFQYLRLQDVSGNTAVDSGRNNLNGTYLATDIPLMLAKNTGPFGSGLVPNFSSANLSWINNYTSGFGTNANGAEGSVFIMGKMNPSDWIDGLQHWLFQMRVSTSYYIGLQKWSTSNQIRARRFAVATDISISSLLSTPLWFAMGMDWSESLNYVRLYINGRQVGSDSAITVPWAGSMTASRIGNSISSNLIFNGNLAEFAVFNNTIGASGHLSLAGIHAERNLFLGYGDSKTSSNTYQHTASSLLESTGNRWDYRTIAASGRTVATSQDNITAELSSYTSNAPVYVLSNLGANDVATGTWERITEENWKADYGYILDAMRSKWSSVKIYIMRPWRRTYGSRCDTLATWIADLVTARSGWCFLGPDERVFLENGDDGATYTSDGLHPNTAGYVLVGTQWANAINGV